MLVEGTGGMHAVNLPFLRDRYNGGRLQRWRGGAAIDRREKGRKGRGLGTPAFTSKTFADVKAAKERGEGPAMPLQRSTSSFSPRPSAAKHGFRSSYPSLTSPAPCFRWLFARRGASTWSSSSSSSPSSNPRLMFERC